MDPTQSPAPAETQDTPPVEAEAPVSEAGQAEDTFTKFNLNEVPEESREYVEAAYNQLRADYVRKRQSDSAAKKEWETERESFQEDVEFAQQFRSDPEYQKQLARELADHYGMTLADAQEAVSENEADKPLTRAEFEQWQQSQQQAEAEASAEQEQMDALAGQLEAIESEDGELSDDEVKFLVSYAINNPNAEGAYDLTDAYAIYKGLIGSKQQAYIASKKSAPQVQTNGVPGSKTPNLDDPEERVAHMASLMDGEAA